jgi:carboxyl-terminal processing protease
MKSRILKFSVLGLILISLSLLVFGSRNETDQLRRELLMKVLSFALENGHYSPADLDNEFSEKVFDNYIEMMDFTKRFLIQEDVNALSEYRTEIDDAIENLDFEFFERSVDILNKRIEESQKIYRDILSRPFDFTVEEQFEGDSDKRTFARDRKELKEFWRKSLKYEALSRIYDQQKTQKKAAEKSDTATVNTFAELEEKARESLLKRYDDWYHRMEKLDEDDRLNVYINAIVSVNDPHTQYFPPRDKENFDIRFSGQLEGIGAQLTQKNAYVEVSKIIPGSPSWKQGDLEVGDYILKVAQDGEEPVDIVDMRLDDAVQLIRGKKGTKVTLTIRKLDGSIEDITLVRDVVILEETYAKSAILINEETNNTYGYIKLPSFYVDFSKINGKNCFDDIKYELAKLEEENIKGLIFDLRNNGGGSLEDVVNIAGLFIEEGPVVQARSSKGQKRILEDTDPRVQFDKPLVVMVNTISASASEIFAAAMQDYSRAIIIGSEHTYGKGTVQNFTELDRMVPKKPSEMKDLGSLKMTVQKFYRINGDATQEKGVVPDIVLPDYYNYMEFGEKDLDYALPWDEISSVNWEPWTLSFDKEYIVDISNKRIAENEMLQLVEENGQRLQQIREKTNVTLAYEDYADLMKQRAEAAERFEQIGKETFDLNVHVLNADLPAMEADTSRKARTDAWLSELQKDVYLLEAFNVLKDVTDYQVKHAVKDGNR